MYKTSLDHKEGTMSPRLAVCRSVYCDVKPLLFRKADGHRENSRVIRQARVNVSLAGLLLRSSAFGESCKCFMRCHSAVRVSTPLVCSPARREKTETKYASGGVFYRNC